MRHWAEYCASLRLSRRPMSSRSGRRCGLIDLRLGRERSIFRGPGRAAWRRGLRHDGAKLCDVLVEDTGDPASVREFAGPLRALLPESRSSTANLSCNCCPLPCWGRGDPKVPWQQGRDERYQLYLD
jgi:hypothetical protein